MTNNDEFGTAQRYYEQRLSDEDAAALEFVPTSTHRNWRGKFKCMWWGHRHGKNCAKRP